MLIYRKVVKSIYEIEIKEYIMRSDSGGGPLGILQQQNNEQKN